jgi:hypothetical protein
VLDLGELDVLMMTPFSQVDVVAVHVDFLHILEDLLHVLGHHRFNLFITSGISIVTIITIILA